jgi:hypothetical protein
MLIYVDESKIPSPKGPRTHITMAAAAICESVHKDFNARLYKLKKRFARTEQNQDFEIKGRNLLKPGFDAYPRNTEFVREVLSLCRQYDIKMFAIIKQCVVAGESESLALDEAIPGLPRGERLLSQLYTYLIERVEAFVRERAKADFAIMVFDEKDARKDEARAHAFSAWMHRSSWGSSLTCVLETAFFVRSQITPGIQIADLFAYVMNQYMEGRRDLQEFYEEIADMQFMSKDATAENPLKGIRYVRARPPEEDKQKGETATEVSALPSRQSTDSPKGQ